MTTNIPPTDLKDLPDTHHTGVPVLPSQKTPGPVNPPIKPKKRALIWVALLILIAAVAGYAVYKAGQPGAFQQAGQGGGGGGRGRGGGRGGNGGAPTPVVTTKALRTTVPVYLNGLGNVTAFYTVAVKSRVDGQLMKVNFQEGDFVKQGQVLAEIDPRPYQVQRDLAEGTLARDTALLGNARKDLERYKTLLAQDAVPRQQLDTQEALVAQYQGNIKQDQANIDNAKLQLTYAQVVAPISGRVGLRLVDPGNIVHASDANGMLVITQIDPISALFTIPEDSLPQVMKKLQAGIKLPVDAYNRDNSIKLATGRLLTVDNTIDASTGTSKLKAVFDNKNNALFPNQFVNIRLLVDTLRDQIVIPSVAVQNGQQGTFVYVVDENSRVHLKPVQVGITEANNSQIRSGIEEGDAVVVDGTDRLQEGMQVRVRRPGELDAPQGGGRRGGGGFRNGGQGGGQGQGGGRGQGQGSGPGQGLGFGPRNPDGPINGGGREGGFGGGRGSGFGGGNRGGRGAGQGGGQTGGGPAQ